MSWRRSAFFTEVNDRAPKQIDKSYLFWHTYIGDDKLRISVNDDFPIEDFFGKDSKQKLVFKEGNQVSPLGSDIKLSNGIKAGFEVVLNKRGGKNLGDGKVCMYIDYDAQWAQTRKTSIDRTMHCLP